VVCKILLAQDTVTPAPVRPELVEGPTSVMKFTRLPSTHSRHFDKLRMNEIGFVDQVYPFLIHISIKAQ
jgi:hypothetical protein